MRCDIAYCSRVFTTAYMHRLQSAAQDNNMNGERRRFQDSRLSERYRSTIGQFTVQLMATTLTVIYYRCWCYNSGTEQASNHPHSFVTVFIGCQSARGCSTKWSSWSGTTFLVDRRGTSRSCVYLCPPINFAVVCDHLSKACYWFQRATPHSCKDEVLPYRDHLNGIVFRQQFESWLEMASPRCSETISKHSCFRSSWINSRTVLDSVPENL